MTFMDAGHGGHNLARCAKSALKTITLDERFLDRVKLVAMSQALDRGDFVTLRTRGKRQARQLPLAVDVDRTGAARSVITSLFRARHVEVIAQGVEQGDACLQIKGMLNSVYLERDRACPG